MILGINSIQQCDALMIS